MSTDYSLNLITVEKCTVENVLRIILIFTLSVKSISAFSQEMLPVNTVIPPSSFSFNPQRLDQQNTRNSIYGNPFASPGSFLALLSNKFNFNVPTHWRYTMASGINFQAGLIMNSKQPKLGATISLPRGLNISAGYGASMPGLGRQGFSTMGRNPGIQVSASYRIFKRK